MFLGRPNLFFALAEPRARWEMKNARYRFGDATAAAAWPNPDFHCIYEPLGAGLPPRPFQTRLVGNQLTDYGLVQRFTAQIDGVAVVVLVIAGATFVGTYAAAYWAAYSMFGDSENTPVIQLPNKVDRKSEFEALIEVQAILNEDETRQPRMRTVLLGLSVASKQWNQDKRKWEKTAPRDVVLVSREAGPPTPQGIEEIWLNGRLARVREQGEIRCLLAAVCLHAQHHTGVNSFDVLLEASAAWTVEPMTLKRLRGQLRALRQRYLGNALETTDGGWRLNARVHLAHN